MAKKTLLDNIIESIKDVDGRLIKQSGTTEQMISDLNYKVVAPAKSAADSAVAYANDAVEKSRVNSQAIVDINSAVSEAVSDAAVARSNGLRAWNAAQSNVDLIDLNYASASAEISGARTEAIAAADEAKASASAAQADIVAVRSDVAAVQADVTANKSDVAAAKSDIAIAKTNLASQATSLSSYAAQASAAGKDITTLKSQAGQLEQGMADTKGDVSQLKVSASSVSATLSDAAGNISSLQATAKSYSAALSDTNSNVASVTATASELETKYADAAGDISKIKTDAKGMTQTISNAQGDIAKLKTRADGFDAEFSTANGNISKLQTDASGTKQTLTNAKSDIAVLQSRADGIDAKYANAAGDINTLKANASGFSQTLTDAKGNISTLQATATGLKNTLTDAQGNISTLQSDVSGLKKTTSDHAGNIATLQADAKTLTSQMSSAQGDISTLKQTASGFSSKVSGMETSLANANSKINDITSNGGGRNLLQGTRDFEQWGSSISKVPVTNGGVTFQAATGTQDPSRPYFDLVVFASVPLEKDTDYTASFWVKTSEDTDIMSFLFDSGSNGIYGDGVTTNQSTTKYTRVVVHFHNGNNNATPNFIPVRINKKSTITVWVYGCMLEKGTVAHDWSPAPEDTDAKITANTTAIEQNKNAFKIKADQADVDTLKGSVTSLQAESTTQADEIKNRVTRSDVIGMLNGYATQDYTQSLISQKAGSFNETITQLDTKFKTGMENSVQLVRKSDFEDGDKGNWTVQAVVSATNPAPPAELGQSGMKVLQTNTRDGYEDGIWYSVKPGEKFDVDYWCAPSTAFHTTFGLVFADKDNNWQWQGISSDQSGQWGHYTGTITAPANASFAKPWYQMEKPGDNTTNSSWIAKPSIRRQNASTISAIQSVQASVDGLKSIVANKTDESQFTQLSNLVQTKVSSDDFTSTTTQLKNEINQRVQVGDVISQINQEAGGDTLIQVSNGKKSLILDAENTIITGEAWIPDAAISSISADKIMLGSSSLWNSDGTLNLLNQSNGLKALIQVKQGLVQDTTQSIISFSSDYNNRAFSVTPVGATITPTLFFERYDQTEGHWLGFTRNEVRRDGLMFHTWDDEGERFFVGCHARFDRNISAVGTINQGTWNGTSGKPEAGIFTITSGNTIWSGSDFLAIGDHISNSFTNVMARSFSQQSTLSSKTNIETVDPKYALDLVNRTDILSYQYKADVAQGKTKRYTSMILDDVNDVSKYYAPDEFANEERTGRDDGSAVGYLFLAVQELTRRIKNLEEKLHE